MRPAACYCDFRWQLAMVSLIFLPQTLNDIREPFFVGHQLPPYNTLAALMQRTSAFRADTLRFRQLMNQLLHR